MSMRMLIDARHPEETRVAVVKGNRIEEFDFESAEHEQLKGNIYLAKVTRVEPSLQAAFIDFAAENHLEWEKTSSWSHPASTQKMRPARAVPVLDANRQVLDDVKEVLDVMKELASEGMTMIVVTHEMNFARDVADQVVFMDGGVVVESGPPSAVLGAPQNARTKKFLGLVLEH